MARPANPQNRYSFTCKVTGETVKTNPKQFAALATRYGITNEELDVSYVSRAGRRVIEAEKLTPEQAAEKYGIHINVANTLKCTVKEKAPAKTETPAVEHTNVQLPEAVSETSIEVSDNGVEVEKSATSFSVSIPADVEESVEVGA